jgi:hypothetical protein
MKRIFGLLFLVGILAISSCGPSAKQRAAEQARLDSIAEVLEQARLDSLDQVRLDSIAAVEAARRATTAPAPTQPAEEVRRERRGEETEVKRDEDGRIQRRGAEEEETEEKRDEDGRRQRRGS